MNSKEETVSAIAATIARLQQEVGDVEALQKKYEAERDRRIRTDGEGQYLELDGADNEYETHDPYAPTIEPREPLTDELDVLIIGGGFSGMLTAARLSEVGIKDIRIVESGADFGGTWYWNRYPGAQCDIESYCYLPLLEETGYIPKEKYSFAPEIFEHSQRVGKLYDLYSLTVFQTQVTGMEWDDEANRWTVRTNRDDVMKPRFVITATGPASRAKIADIPGLDTFQGKKFHTSRWDYEYTGGDRDGNLDKLGDKKVAVIGTGATAIQVIPHLGASAEHLYVFQRTPSTVDLRGNKPTDPEWAASLKPGWQDERRKNFNDILLGVPVEDMVQDGWTEIFREITIPIPMGQDNAQPEADPADIALMAQLADYKKMNRLRKRIEDSVQNPATAEALKPWYSLFCKRPTFNDNYLPTFNRPNVTLVDTADSKGVERITEKGVVANGVEYEVDCIVLATGFEIGTEPRRRFNFDIIGRGGQSVFDYWAQGLRTLHGYTVHGFPNWFHIGLGQSTISPNMTSAFDEQARHVAYVISEVDKRGATVVQPTKEGEQAWVDIIRQQPPGVMEFLQSCTPGYYNNEGRPDKPGAHLSEQFPGGTNAFNAMLEEWRAEGALNGLELR